MFNNIEKFLIDQHVDTIRQERELLKQIAVLSSAIVAIFALNIEKFNLGLLAKIGLIGLFITIIFSIFLLALILRLEKTEIYQAINLNKKSLKIVGDWTKSLFSKYFGKFFKKVINNALQDEHVFKKFGEEIKKFSIINFLIERFGEAKRMYDDLKREEEETKKKTKKKSVLYARLSYFAIIIFCTSLILIMIDVIKIIF
jgi:hypothetical protein